MKLITISLLLSIFSNCSNKEPIETEQTIKPAERNAHSMVYDATNKKILLFGGTLMNGSYSDELWQWDGEWTLKKPTGAKPTGREDAMLVHSTTAAKTYLIGGRTSTQKFTDFWEWDGTKWTLLSAATPFGGLDHATAVYDGKLNRVLVFGGASDRFTNDLWIYESGSWRKAVSSGSVPSERIASQLVYNPENEKTYLFGGFSQPNTVMTDVWELNGDNWINVNINIPLNVLSGSISKSPGSNQYVLFGGAVGAAPNNLSNETWIWDGVAWIKKNVNGSPSKRFLHQMVYHPVANKSYLFGGGLGNGVFANDLWEWDGNSWKLIL